MTQFERFHKFLAYLEKHRQHGYDMCVAVSGAEGAGKTALACQAGRHVKDIQNLGQWREFINKNVGYKLTEALEEIRTLDQDDFYVIDEAIRGMYKRDSLKTDNKEMVRMFTQIRMKQGMFFINIPRFIDLDEFYRNHRVRVWVEVIGNERDENDKPKLFHAVVFEKDEHAFNPDPWSLKKDWKMMQKNFKAMRLIDSIEDKIQIYSQCTAYAYHFTYPPIRDDWWEEFMQLSNQRKLDADAVEQTSIYQRGFVLMAEYMRQIYEKNTYEIAEIAVWHSLP